MTQISRKRVQLHDAFFLIHSQSKEQFKTNLRRLGLFFCLSLSRCCRRRRRRRCRLTVGDVELDFDPAARSTQVSPAPAGFMAPVGKRLPMTQRSQVQSQLPPDLFQFKMFKPAMHTQS